MKVGDVMTLDLEVLAADATVGAAARLMAELDSDALPVGINNKLVPSCIS